MKDRNKAAKSGSSPSSCYASLVEAVAQSIWDAKVGNEDEDRLEPMWNELDDRLDRNLKDEIRAMAEAAIRTIREHNAVSPSTPNED